ncbi:DUF1330 domain-containing protein [Micromonospora sp. NPDC048930]|uniref:DUF1330 domain-containing protein n=1 Tax=Micromonospora sp. NPDC048930 TaxID=3364261 RepID=UPI003714A9C2
MPAFALAHLRTTGDNDDIIEYIDRIQATLDPYQGRFRVHGGVPDVLEGEWPGSVVIIEFPDLQHARDWYASPAYQEILPLRTRHLDASTIIIQGVGPDYDPRRTAARMRQAVG